MLCPFAARCIIDLVSVPTCVNGYQDGKISISPFGLALRPEGLDEVRYTSEAWGHQNNDVTGGLSYGGTFATYQGDGFIADFDLNRNISAKIIEELKQNLWIDRQTRAVFLEFTIYNPNVNIFASAILAAEFSQFGGALTSSRIQVFRVYSVGINGIFTTVCEVLFCLFLLYNMVILIMNSVKTKCATDSRMSLVMDIFIVGTSIYLIVMWALRFTYLGKSMAQYRQDDRSFVKFNYVSMYDSLYKNGWAFMTCFITLKLCLLLKLNARFARLGYTLRDMIMPLWRYLVQALPVWVAFTCLAYLWFMRHIFLFSDITKTASSLLSFALGGFRVVDEMMEYDTHFSRFFFLSYMIYMNLLMVNTLVSVVLDSQSSFKNREVICDKDYKMLALIRKDISGFVKKAVRASADH